MDLHGSYDLMLFKNHIDDLESKFDTKQPLAFKVGVVVNDFGVRFNLKKIETLEEAQGEKLRKKRPNPNKIVQKPFKIAIDFDLDTTILYTIFDIISKNQGKREFHIIIKSKFGDIVLESGYYINSYATKQLQQLNQIVILE